MIKIKENKRINEDLKKLYEDKTKEFLKLWEDCFKGEKAPDRINEFGIIDTEKFDTEKRILVIGKETNGSSWWKPNIYPFLTWIKDDVINWKTDDGKTKETFPNHPNMWYNIGRWAKFMCNPTSNIEELIAEKKEALSGLSYIAYTNINKIGGYERSNERYRNLSKENEVIKLIIQEIETIKPKHIVLCDDTFAHILLEEYTKPEYKKHIQLKNCIINSKFIVMPHPAAQMKTDLMLHQLREKMQENSEYKTRYLYNSLIETTVSKLLSKNYETDKKEWHKNAGWIKFTNINNKEIRWGWITLNIINGLITFSIKNPDNSVSCRLKNEEDVEIISDIIVNCVLEKESFVFKDYSI